MNVIRLLSRSALACALAFSLSACDSNDDENSGPSGSAYAALFDNFGSDGGPAFAIVVFDGTVSAEAAESYRGDALSIFLPSDGEGTYEAGIGQDEALVGYSVNGAFNDFSPDQDDVFTATSGTVRITSVGSAEVTGSYDVRVVNGTGTRSLSGSFAAAVVDSNDLPNARDAAPVD